MTLAELKVTQSGLARARSQPMRNTLAVIEQEFRGRGLTAEEYWAAASVIVAKEISGLALEPSEPGLMGRLAEGESGKFLERLVEDILMGHAPDSGPLLDYDVNLPNGDHIEIRNRCETFTATPSSA